MVHGLFKSERHDLGTLGGDLLLTAGRRTEADAIEEAEHGYNAKNHDDNDGNTVVIFMPKTLIYRHPHTPFPLRHIDGFAACVPRQEYIIIGQEVPHVHATELLAPVR